MQAAAATAIPAAVELTTTPASAANAAAMVRQATLCNSSMSTECGTSALTASSTSEQTGLAPRIVSVPEALMIRVNP